MMSLKLLKGTVYVLVLVLCFIVLQFFSISYKVITTTITTPQLEINLKEIKQNLSHIPAVKNKGLILKRKKNWSKLSADNLFKTKSSNFQLREESRAEKKHFLLTATSVFNNQTNDIAMLKVKETNKSYLVKEGDTIGDYRVQEIKSQQVVLMGSGGKVIVDLMQIEKGGAR